MSAPNSAVMEEYSMQTAPYPCYGEPAAGDFQLGEIVTEARQVMNLVFSELEDSHSKLTDEQKRNMREQQ